MLWGAIGEIGLRKAIYGSRDATRILIRPRSPNTIGLLRGVERRGRRTDGGQTCRHLPREESYDKTQAKEEDGS